MNYLFTNPNIIVACLVWKFTDDQLLPRTRCFSQSMKQSTKNFFRCVDYIYRSRLLQSGFDCSDLLVPSSTTSSSVVRPIQVTILQYYQVVFLGLLIFETFKVKLIELNYLSTFTVWMFFRLQRKISMGVFVFWWYKRRLVGAFER